MDYTDQVPVILTFSPHDPTGCGGQSADIETATSLGCHAATVITALAARDTRELIDLQAVDVALVIEQARALLEDIPIAAIKIGGSPSVANCEAIHSILLDYPKIPVVLDATSNNTSVHRHGILLAMQTLLIPQAHLLYARHTDLQILAPAGDTTDAKARQLLDKSCRNLLVSRCRSHGNASYNRLYQIGSNMREYEWPGKCAQADSIMGAGATMTTAIASFLAHGCGLEDACLQAQQFTWQSLLDARRIGMGKLVPNRLFWATQRQGQKRYKH